MTIASGQLAKQTSTGGVDRVQEKYILYGDDASWAEVKAWMLDTGNVPFTHPDDAGLYKTDVTPITHVRDQNPEYWTATAVYQRASASIPKSPGNDPDNPTFQFSFQFRTATQRIKHSDDVQSRFPVTAPDMDFAINAQPDGKVEGTDVLVPADTFSFAIEASTTFLTNTYLRNVRAIRGHVNSTDFPLLGQNEPAGSVIFLGIQGTVQSEGNSNIQFDFAYEANRTAVTVAGITGVNKDGWDYLWPYYQKGEDVGAKETVPEVVGIYVNRIYQRSDLAGIIGL